MTLWLDDPHSELATLEPVTRARVIAFFNRAAARGVPIRMVEGARSWDRQAKLHARGTSKADPLHSAHCRAAAADFCLHGPEPYPIPADPRWGELAALAADCGLRSGLSWGDADHVERADWQTLPGPRPPAGPSRVSA